MAAPMDWGNNNSNNPRFNHRNYPPMPGNQQQHMQRFNTQSNRPVMSPQAFNRPFNPRFNVNSGQPYPITGQVRGTSNVPGNNFDQRGSQDINRFPLPSETWPGPFPGVPNNNQFMSPPPQQLLGQTQSQFQLGHPDNTRLTNIVNQSVQQKHLDNRYTDDVRNDDKAWVNDWCKKRTSTSNEQANKCNKFLKISETQDKTRQMMVLLARLQKNKQMLETLKNEDKSIWDQKLKEVQTVKSELECLQNEVMSEENVKQLQEQIQRRKKKRERIKQRRQILYEEKTKQLADRETKHVEIDKAMQQIIRKQSVEKQEKDMQKEADEILSQVRKKQSEASKYLHIVNSMQKLRKLRTDRLERQGVLGMYEARGSTCAGKLMFEAKVSNILQLLNKQLDIYKSEEAALKVHLETEHEETRVKEREKNRLMMIERQKKSKKKEEQMLFGSQRNPVPGDPLYPFRQYYDSASHDLNSLISIRREWDQYLCVPGAGSCIPEDWVIPTPPSNDTWASVLN